MKRTYLLLIIFLFSLGSISAQTFVGKLNQNPSSDFNRYTSSDTLKILAVMSDFQVDIDDATFGDGTFESIYSEDYGTSILDPLPHDKAYFENHFKFVQNYFAKVSNGNLNISYTVLDDVLTVSQTMRNYTPPLDDLNNHEPLGEYLNEVWKLADAQYPNFNFADYDMFFVLHAGVGKDISLPGSLGNERDLPSVYMNKKSLQNVFGSDFEGFPVNDGNFKITNSAIFPETESREIGGFDGITLIELTTNGLMAATIGSYLGLPDLYNTETGRSAIGRFGLMDGQSMFSFQGIYPPEPSAWEKMFLGWVTPTEISIGNSSLSIVNKFVASPTDTSLIKIPINATEYYLIENRKRDALKDGSTVTYISNGKTYTKSFNRDYENYIYYSVDTLEGVIIDVDEYDWALPSFDRDAKLENFEDVGLIIWHIDERIIADNYETNTINNDRYKRGVAIVEADGIRDIGEEFQTVFGEQVIGEGTKEDTWYKNNPADYYENKFSADTKPKAESNTGTNSLITLTDFSEISNRTSFNVAFGSENIDLIGNMTLNYENATISFQDIYWLSSVNNGNNVVHFATNNGRIIKFNSNEVLYNYERIRWIDYKPLVVGINGEEIIVTTDSDKLKCSIFDERLKAEIDIIINDGDFFRTSPVIFSQTDSSIEFLIGTEKGAINNYTIDIIAQTITLTESNQIFNTPAKQIAVSGNQYSAISSNYIWSSEFSKNPIQLDLETVNLVATRDENGNFKSIVHLKSEKFASIIDETVSYSEYSTSNIISRDELGYTFPKVDESVTTSLESKLILADIKNDGENYLVLNSLDYLNSFNQSGAMASNFPIKDEFQSTFVSSPLSVDLNNDDAGDIITCTEDGKILAIDGITGKMIDGFPISSGGRVATTPIIFTENGRTALGVITENNQFMSWNISQYDGKQFWTEENGNASNSSSVAAASSGEAITDFFPQSKAYNWPNPVYEGVTNIRYFVSEDSEAEVTIFDLAGDLVAKLSGHGIGGFDNEIVWNVNNIQSGIYFAHLEVKSNSGKTDTKIIKIAVIK